MRALLDVNVLIALLDSDHAFHGRAHHWWAANGKSGWASCPLTENGVVRIMSNPSYSKAAQFTPSQLIEYLNQFAGQTNHQFWPDELSILDRKIFAAERIHSLRLITDIYLLALASTNHGRLVTFDQGIPLSSVQTAKPTNLLII